MSPDKQFKIKNDGKIKEAKNGWKKDNQEGKVDYTLIPYETLLRLAWHFTNGAKKYGEGNWKKAIEPEQIKEYMKAANRHLEQWKNGQTDEDHASACITNIMMYEWLTHHQK